MKTHKDKGIITIEVIVAIGLLVTFIGVIAVLGQSFGKLNRTLWLKHTCLAAGQAQLDSVAAVGHPIAEDKFQALWPNVQYSIERTEGQGQWQGLEKIEVHLTASSQRQRVDVSLMRYLGKNSEVQP